jgi:hypothetical protein
VHSHIQGSTGEMSLYSASADADDFDVYVGDYIDEAADRIALRGKAETSARDHMPRHPGKATRVALSLARMSGGCQMFAGTRQR